MENLKITIVQPDTSWHNVEENLTHIESLIKNNPATDLIILPEMFNTGYTMEPGKVSEEMNGPTVNFLLRISHELSCDVTGSAAIKENGNYYNRMLWVKPGGEVLTYDKRHLFRMAGEEKIYSAGSSHLTVSLKGWRIRPFVCYDLRFPAWTRNNGVEYDLALFAANWPAVRESHWDTLLHARAIENQCFVAGINRTGEDGKNVRYNGRSSVIDYYGNTMFCADAGECVHTVELSCSELLSYRKSFPAWKDADWFTLTDKNHA